MSFLIDIVEAIIDIIVAVVELVVQIVEVIIEFIMTLIGYDEVEHVIEYFEIHNVPLFEDVDSLNPLLETMKEAIITNSDIAGELIYASTFRDYKGDIRKFINFIDNGNYNEGFPLVESFITFPDYDELTATLLTLTGVACTPENSYTTALSRVEWIEFWLQENTNYYYSTGIISINETVDVSTSTSPASTSETVTTTYIFNYALGDDLATEDSITVNALSPVTTSPGSISSSATLTKTITIDIIDEVATSEAVTGSTNLFLTVDTGTIVYNSGPDTYNVDGYDANDVYTTLPQTITSKPTGLHYLSYYYKNSAPLVTFIFVYKVGTGTYPDLDNPQNEINIDASELHTIPAIPLRLNNIDYLDFPKRTSFIKSQIGTVITIKIEDDIGITEEGFVNAGSVGSTTSTPSIVRRIDELCDLISINAEDLLEGIRDDPNAPSAGDLDHIYVTFGVRLKDTSQTGMSYMFGLCENLFPTLGVTQGIYDNTVAGDTKPQNNIIISSDDYKSLFQFSYISYAFTILADINADSGSDENGFYYSDLSRFYYDTSVETQPGATNSSVVNNTIVSTNILLAITDGVATSDRFRTEDLTLKDPYYVSSAKGTYNVGFKSENLTEVANFLTGSGTVNPGTTTGEATDWMQVTTRLVYNDTSPVLQNADGIVSALKFLTPDLVYENNGSGVLRLVQSASEETTAGQSITYYRAIESGLEAYTMASPISSLRVIDGATGVFKMVKFNLGSENDLMAPFIHNFIEDLSNKQVTQLFLSGSHASIYIANYEVIIERTSAFSGILVVIIIIIIAVIAWYAAPAFFSFMGFAGAGTTTGLLAAIGLVPATAAGTALTVGVLGQALMTFMVKFAVTQLVKLAITSAFGDTPTTQFIGSLAGAAVSGGLSVDSSYAVSADFSSFTEFSLDAFINDWSYTDTFKFMVGLAELGSVLTERYVSKGLEGIAAQLENARIEQDKRLLDLTTKDTALRNLEESLFDRIEDGQRIASLLINVDVRAVPSPMPAERIFTLNYNYTTILEVDTSYDEWFEQRITQPAGYA